MITTVAVLAALLAPSAASAGDVPAVMGYHSVVFDEGGNPIADGDWDVWFRITDVNGEVFYEERQSLPAIGGRVSALIGNGLDGSGAPTGGLPEGALEPGSAKYLEVEVEGIDPLPAVELASVPYASYSQIALGAAAGSVDYDALADGVVERIAEGLTGGAGADAIILRDELGTLYSDSSSATTIGVSTAGFGSSTADDLQCVLADIDAAIATNATNVANLTTALSAESGARASADSSEVGARAAADSAETSSRAAADNALDVRLDAVESPSRLSFMRSAWGSVSGGSSPSIAGQNVTVAWEAMGVYRIGFTQPMPSANFAVVLTPTGGSPSAEVPAVYDKDSTGFRVSFSISAGTQNFDFLVLSN